MSIKVRKNKTKALVLFSGGLDSILAVKLLEKQGVEVVAVTWVSYFFDAQKAEESANKNKIYLRVMDFSEKHAQIVRKPKRGYGSAMNPCIDCHLLMIQATGKLMRKEKFDLVATGEVLGQRPMSQNTNALQLIERESGIRGKLLRPLSAKLLPETEIEKAGVVDRNKLLDLSGRSRKRQVELARKFQIEYYPAPGGGCSLTEIEFGKKLKKMFFEIEKPIASDYQLLRMGRIFWIDRVRIVIGRNQNDNDGLRKNKEKDDIIIEMENFSGPTALVRGKVGKEVLEKVKKMVIGYSRQAREHTYEEINFKISE